MENIISTEQKLSNLDQAAIILLNLKEENAVQILQKLSEKDVKTISQKILSIQDISAKNVIEIISKFLDKISGPNIIGGNVNKVQNFLNQLFPPEKVAVLMSKLTSSNEDSWEYFSEIPDQTLADFLKNEYPQTVALILYHLPTQKSAQILSFLQENFAFEVIQRILDMEQVDEKTMANLENSLKNELTPDYNELPPRYNEKKVANIFSNLNQENEAKFFDLLTKKNSYKATKVRRYMLFFDDILRLDADAMQLLIKKIEKSLIIKALKFSNLQMQNHFFANLSKRAVKVLEEELQLNNTIKKNESEIAQKEILKTLQELINKSLIFLPNN